MQNLARRGIDVFCPRILEPVGWATDWVTAPLFPGYLFVHVDLINAFHPISWTPGVKGFVAFGDMPTAVRPEIIAFLRHESGENGVINPVRRLRAGARVTIKRGPFAGLIGIVEKPCPERGRIRVLMDFLRQGTTVELPLAAIGRV